MSSLLHPTRSRNRRGDRRKPAFRRPLGLTIAALGPAAQWEVELFYKTAKSGLGLKELPTSKVEAVRALVRATLIRATVAMQAQTIAERYLPPRRWINPVQWTAVWRQALGWLADDLLSRSRREVPMSWRMLAALAMDPNVGRPPTHWRLMRGSWRS